MSVLIVFHSLYSLAGGVDNRISQLELDLSKNFETKFLLFKNEVDLPHRGEIHFINSIVIPKVILSNKFKFKIFAYFYGFINLFYRIFLTRKFLKKDNSNTVLAIDDYFSLIVILASIGLNKKIVSSVRNNWNKLYSNSMIHLLPDFMYKKVLPKLMNKYVKNIHCVSEELTMILKEEYNIKNTISIYNLFDIPRIKSLSKENIEIKEEYFINIGHFNEQKNQKDLILMYQLLKEKFNIKEKLLLLGDGKFINDCKELSKNIGLSNDILFLGKQQNPYKYLSKAKLYISTSLYEGLPAVFVESLILDIPIVSYDFKTGAKELCNNLSSSTPEALCEKVYELLSDNRKLQLSKEFGEKKIKEKFENKVILEEWLKIL